MRAAPPPPPPRGNGSGSRARSRDWARLLQRFFESVDELAAFIEQGGLAEIAALLPGLCDRMQHAADSQLAALTLQVSSESCVQEDVGWA